MKSSIIFTSKSNNKYLISTKEQFIIPFTPPMLYVKELIHKYGEDDVQIPDKTIIDNKAYNKKEIVYYLDKYKYLKNNGLIDNKGKDDEYTGTIKPKQIEWELANFKHLVFEVTDACNLNCKYCAYGDFYNNYDNRENKFLSFEKAKNVIDFLSNFWNSPFNQSKKNIDISFYGGEPLLNIKLIKKIITYVENKFQNKQSFNWRMTTNAVLLDKYMDYLVEKKFNLLISLDGNKHNHSYRVNKMGKNSFDNILKNVKSLQEKYPAYFKTNVNFNAVLHNRNSVNEIISFMKNQFDKIPSIGELNENGIHPDKVQKFYETYRNFYENLKQSENYDELSSALEFENPDTMSAAIFIHQYSGNVFKKYSDLFVKKEKQTLIPTGTCFPFNRKFFVTVTGKILPCERIGQECSLGQVTDKEVEIDFEKIVEIYNTFYKKLQKQCSKCYIASSCQQCIFYIKDKTKPVCKGFTNEEKFIKYLSIQYSYLETQQNIYRKIMEELILD